MNTERGYGTDNDATIYILNYDKPGQEQYYVRLTNRPANELLKLDRERRIITNKRKYILKKILLTVHLRTKVDK
ncbi:hypothetical protein [Elizabethkingia anophelis]|uniref:hypothetical protein n=1 Tax=Elizabethkingia anophelis TaxID=1117645 RepID=UPI0021A70D41|nr:hypothetical protein [Elizabethkingia anophelis]MCT4260515.1 hypothetical protein [Elizabethkingia anophelis]